MSRREKNVLGFNVAVDDPLSVCVGERIRDISRHVTGDFWGELFFAVDAIPERLAAHVWHHVVEKILYVS